MGSFRARRSKTFGPVRITVSKRGISTSIGKGPVRITKRTDGKVTSTLRIPGTGVSYVNSSGNPAPPYRDASHAPQQSAETYTISDAPKAEKMQQKRGHNTMVTGLGMMVFGTIFAAIAFGTAFGGLCVFVAIGGLITNIVGWGMRRERG